MTRGHTPPPGRGSALKRERHVVQFQLGVLELERTRRENERRTAQQKIDEIERRLRQIDALIRDRQRTLDRDRRYARHSRRRQVNAEV